MSVRRVVTLLVALAMIASARSARGVVVLGGGDPRSDCYLGFEIEGTSNTSGATAASPTTADELACGASCTFRVKLCTNEPVAGCSPATVERIRLKNRRGPPPRLPGFPPTKEYVCGASFDLNVPAKRRTRARFVALTSDGTPRKDHDVLRLRCRPNPANVGCVPVCDTPPVCPGNLEGGPEMLNVTMLGSATDFDLGWTGATHNFAWPKDLALSFCLSGCGLSANPVCTGAGATGAGSPNGSTFGPPLPVVADGVAMCLVNRFAKAGPDGITATLSLDTGEAQADIDLISDVFVTDALRVCPRCETGTCDSGARRNQPCTVHGSVTVLNSAAPNKLFKLSRDCPPLGEPVGAMRIPLRLTTGTVGTPGNGGSKPCATSPEEALLSQDDSCGAGGCGSPCEPGSDACTTTAPNPSDPEGPPVCVDVKGGLSQVCCNDDPSEPCFPTRPGDAGIVRTGRAIVPEPPWPDPSYPKAADAAVLVATACAEITGFTTGSPLAPLPQPVAVIFSTRIDVLRAGFTPCRPVP